MKKVLVLLVLASLAGIANADLLVDFGTGSSAVEAGYAAYTASHEQAATFTTQTYTAFGTTISVTPTWAEGAVPAVMQMVDRGAGTYTSDNVALVQDWIGSDTRSAGDPLTLTISGVPAGVYTYVSYHHDSGTDAPLGTFDVLVDGVAVGSSVTSTNDSVTVFADIAKFSTTINSNGVDDITITYDNQPYTSPQGYNDAWFVMDGFDMAVVPEPATMAILGLGALLLRRKR